MEKRKENQLRRKLAAVGLSLRKSRAKTPNANNLCGFQIISRKNNAVISGSRFELDLQEIETITSNL